MSYAYGPRIYYGPITDPADEPEVYCECGRSVWDCPGNCYQMSLLQLADPVTGERPLPMSDHQ
jgi:hypothetical protein